METIIRGKFYSVLEATVFEKHHRKVGGGGFIQARLSFEVIRYNFTVTNRIRGYYSLVQFDCQTTLFRPIFANWTVS